MVVAVFEAEAAAVAILQAAAVMAVSVVMPVAGATAMVAVMLAAMADAIWAPQRSEQPQAPPLMAAPTTTPISAAIIPIRPARIIDRPNHPISRFKRFANQKPPAFAGGPFSCSHSTGNCCDTSQVTAPRLFSTMVARVLKLASECGEVVKRLNTWEEEVGAAFYGRESRQALYLSPDRPLRDGHIVAAVLSADHRIAFVA